MGTISQHLKSAIHTAIVRGILPKETTYRVVASHVPGKTGEFLVEIPPILRATITPVLIRDPSDPRLPRHIFPDLRSEMATNEMLVERSGILHYDLEIADYFTRENFHIADQIFRIEALFGEISTAHILTKKYQ